MRVRFNWPPFVLGGDTLNLEPNVPKFMLIFRGGGYAGTAKPSPTELQAHLARWASWTEGMIKAGKLVTAQGLTHPPTGKVVEGRAKTVTDGPYAEAKDLVSGIQILECASIAEATELARGCPILEYDGSVEVRPVLDQPRG